MLNVEEELLRTGLYEENSFFHMYLNLMTANKNTTYDLNQAKHNHHIIPNHILTTYTYEINEKDYIISLKVSDHVLAHYYLYKCSSVISEKYANLNSLNLLLNSHMKKVELDNLSQDEMLTIAEARNCLKENLRFVSGAKNLEKIYIHKDNVQKKIYKQYLDEYISKGWVKGGLPFTEEHKLKLRKTKKMSEEAKLRLKGRCKGFIKIKRNGVVKSINPKDLPTYLLQGWERGGRKHTEEEKQAASEKFKGRPISEEQKKQISQTLKGYRTLNKDGKEAHVYPQDIDAYLSDGWTFGRVKKNKIKK